MKASELLRTGEDIYKELNLKNVNDEEKLIEIMVQNPILIERPIIIKDDIAVIARPIENLEELLK
jgi:arsenate reductase